ncbi:hypothetical protein A4G19_06795 [Pasteurellaceae bacterium Macca]|nr:hypothetical protein [Pasteurellaceae bacterium Macca]
MSYLTLNSLLKEIDKIYYKFDEVDINQVHWHSDYSKQLDGINFKKIIYGFDELKERLFEPFKKYQSNIYNTLSNMEIRFFYVIKNVEEEFRCIQSDITRIGFELNDNVFFIRYSQNPYGSDEMNNLSKITIPSQISQSWFSVTNYWSHVENLVMDFRKSQLPSSTFSLLSHILYPNGEKKSHLPLFDFVSQKFGKILVTQKNYEQYTENEDDYVALRCLLDTRKNEDYSPTGFQIFKASIAKENPDLYVVPNANLLEIKRLIDPAHVIDLYGAHVFSGNEPSDFDFMKYAEDF